MTTPGTHSDAGYLGLIERMRFQAQLLDAVGQVVVATDLGGTITYCNRAAEELFGYARDELLGRDITFVLPHDLPADLQEAVQDGLDREGAWSGEYRVRRRDGSVILVLGVFNRVIDAAGSAVGMIGTATDISVLRRVEETLRNVERRHRALFDAAPIGIELVDDRGMITESNAAFQEMLGYAAEELAGRHWTEITHPDDIAAEEALDLEMDTGDRERYQLVKRFIRKDGETIWARLSSSDVGCVADGDYQFTIGMVEDITEQQRAQEALRKSEDRYRSVVEATPDGIVIADFEGNVQFANAQFARLLGFDSAAEVVSRSGMEFVYPEDREVVIAEMQAIATRGHASDIRVRQVRRDGTVFPTQWSGGLVHGENGNPVGIIAVMRDISGQLTYEDQLRHLALHDALTDIPNRTLLMDRLAHALAATKRGSKGLALLLMDLDRFKEINDTYGHQLGDAVLVEVAHRLKSALRESDTVARLGGDEFAVMLPDVDLLGALQTVSKIASILEQPVDLGDQRFQVGASIGIVLAPHHGDSAEGLLRRADVAMYAAKRTNSGYAVYSPEHDSFSPLRLALINELRDAIESDQLVLHYQPKLNLKSGQIEMVEALVRWQHPVHGLIPPDQFIMLAEQSGLIRPLTIWVVRNALDQCRAWRRQGLDLGVSVNLSARSLHDPQLVAGLEEQLQIADVPADRFTLEITESTIMAEPERAMEVLRRIEDLGIFIAIDDFGTGYSSLAYLRELGAHRLKIDKSFVFALAEDNPEAFIVKAVIDLGHNLGLEVVAEGVESQAVIDTLCVLNCDWAQGYHISRPLPAATLTPSFMQRADVRRLGRQIVLVEDETGIREVVTDLLADAGYSVLAVSHPTQAADLPATLNPSLFLIDVMLPGISGIELAQTLQQRGCETPMLAMTASPTMQGLASASGLFRDVLHKPFDADVLLAAVSQVLA